MGNQLGNSRRIAHMRERTIALLMPDTYQIKKPTRAVTPSGSYTEAYSEPLLYRGLPDIPCRLDVSKSYRAGEEFGQEVVVNDFELNVPYDAPLLADYRIFLNGDEYEVRKLLDVTSWHITKAASVSRVDVGKRS